MTIGVDIRVLGSNFKSGIEEYTENLLGYLIPLDKNVKYKLFYSSFNKKIPHYDWMHHENVEVKKFNIPNKILSLSSRIAGRPLVDQMIGGADLFFSPHFLLLPISRNCKRVTTIHDLSFIRFPEFFSWRKLLWHKLEMNPMWQAKFSDRIITGSESTKKDLESLFNIDPSRISVIYSGIDPQIKRPSDSELLKFKIEKKLPDNFILFLGKIEPRKNIVGLIKAFNKLKEINKFKDLNLIIGGAKGWLFTNVMKEAKKSKWKDNIIFTDYIRDDDKSCYYSLARCFVYPSFFEGFGFPNIEAMRCGTPVVTSNNSSIPEVVGEGALLVNPYSVDELAKAIRDVLSEKKLADELILKGLVISKKYNWTETAQKTLQLLQNTINV